MHLNLDVGYFFVSKRYRKFLLLMKLVIILLTLTFLHASATTYSQMVTLSAKNISIERVLTEVEKQTGYNLFYKYSEKMMSKTVDVDFNNAALKVVLNEVLLKNGLSYKVNKNTIVITYFKGSEQTAVIESAKQEGELTGTIFDKTTNQPLIGASVKIKGTNSGTITDEKGSFLLKNAKSGDVIQVFFIGFKLQELTLGSVRKLEISLEEDLANLDGIIVTGYSTQKKREITGSISSIKAADISGAQTISIDGAMQGRMAGVNVQSRVGVPGAAIKIEIRGQGSITAGTEPIYIVDGLIVNSDNSTNTVSTNPLANVNPEDIESIEVLKDAAAASVYGAQAANGVVLVTTKKGKTGRVNVEASYRGGGIKPINLLEMLNSQQYLNSRYEAIKNYNPTYTDAQVWNTVLTQSQLPTTYTSQDIANLQTYDWQKAAFTDGATGKYDVAVSGGSDKSNYRISASWEDTQGSIIGSDFTRGTANFNYANKLTDKIEVTSTINLSTIAQHGPLGATGTTSQFSAPSYANAMILPFIPIYKEDGSYNMTLSGFPGTFARHTLHSTELNESLEKSNSLFGNLQVQYKILSNLSFKALVGLDYRDISARQYYDPRTIDGNARQGILTEYQSNPVTFTTSHVLQYQPKLTGKHTLNTLIGVEYRSFENQSSNVTGNGFPNPQFKQLASAATITAASSSWTGFKRLGSFFQANYTYDSKYMASAIIRYDGSSRFGSGTKFGWFPAISLGWDIAKEDFISNKSLFSQLKLRLGYGETGNNQIGNFDSRSLYGGGITYNGQAGIRPNNLGNSNLRWERNVSTNLGLDYSLLNNKIFGAIDLYYRSSKDLLLSKPVAWAYGYNDIMENLGEVVNKGVEIEIGANWIRKQDLKWTTSFNISFQKNEVVKLYDGLTVLPGDNGVAVGYPLRTHVLPQYAGVNAGTGRAMWYDKDGNYTYSPGAMTYDSYAPYGFPTELPDFFGGLNNTLQYKGFSLGVFFQYDYGRTLYDNQGRTMGRAGGAQINSMVLYYDNRWLTEGQITSVPRPIDNVAERGGSARGDLPSTRYLQDASYIRLKNINLGYTLPQSLISKLKLRSVKVFAQGNNLYTWTKYTGYDPEFYVSGNTSSTNSNTGIVPITKSYYFGVQLGF